MTWDSSLLTDCFLWLRASGKILKAYAQDFEALSKDGHLYVVVQNTGYVTADFSVSETTGLPSS